MQRQHRIVDAGPGGQGKRAVGLERRFFFVETVGFVVMNEYLTIPLRVSQSLWDKTMPHDTPDLSFHVRSVCVRYISWIFLGTFPIIVAHLCRERFVREIRSSFIADGGRNHA